MKAFLSRWLPLLAWAAVIFLVSAQPEPLDSVPQGFSAFLTAGEVFGVGLVAIISFLIHFSLYLVLGFLAGRGMLTGHKLKSSQSSSAVSGHHEMSGKGPSAVSGHHEMSGQGQPLNLNTFLAFALCFAYALSDEVHQTFVRGRGFELVDLLADALGILAGLGLYVLIENKQGKHPS